MPAATHEFWQQPRYAVLCRSCVHPAWVAASRGIFITRTHHMDRTQPVHGLLGVRSSQRLGGRHLQMILFALIATAAIRLFWELLEEVHRGDPLFIMHVSLSGTAGFGLPCSQTAGAWQSRPFEDVRRSACPGAPEDGIAACAGTGQNQQQVCLYSRATQSGGADSRKSTLKPLLRFGGTGGVIFL